MDDTKATKGAPAKRRGKRHRAPTILAGEVEAAARSLGFGAVMTMTPPPDVLRSDVDSGWLDRLHHLFAAWIREAVPEEVISQADALFYCTFVLELLKEHQENGLSTRDLLLSARKIAGRMDVANVHRYAFVGIVAEGATGDVPRRTRKNRASKTPDLIPLVARQWVQRQLFNEAGEQVRTKKEAIELTHAFMADVLCDPLVPTKRKVGEYYANWIAEQPRSVPRAHGNTKVGK